VSVDENVPVPAETSAENGEPATKPASPEEDRARALALLEATHEFPCHYTLTVIAFNADPVTSAVKTAVTDGVADHSHQAIESKAGKYLSHRFAVKVNDASHVLEIYARIRSVDGVVTIL
jgi:putative lipoic acid-binding regulatory protein